MQHSGYGPSVGWTIASLPFHKVPGIGWRLHMSRIAAEIRPLTPVRAPRR
jgi:hypothetical protein